MGDDGKPAPPRPDGPLIWEEPLSGRTVGEYIIGELMGEGGYGYIYRARQKNLAREVVIKVLRWHGEQEDDNTQRFLREARLASQLDHPYAAHIYSFGVEHDGLLWMAMEMVRGTQLKEFLAVQGSIPLQRFVPFLEKLCEVVYTAHQQGIVHRDIKPSNVMVLSRAGRMLPKLLDFGIARLIDDATAVPTENGDNETTAPLPRHSNLSSALAEITGPAGLVAHDATITRRGVSIGSPPYMAPEQWAAADRSDARADQYALAVLTYESLTGRRPFRATSPTALAVAHATKPVPPLGDGFSPDLDEVITRGMAKNPADRYRDVLGFASAFRAAAGLDVQAEPLPRLGVSLREAMMAKAPQPLADSVALLEAAQTPQRGLDAAYQVIRVAARLLGLLAVAAAARVGVGKDEHARAARQALQTLRKRSLASSGWLELTRILVAPFQHRPDAHPVPEMVLLFAEPPPASASEARHPDRPGSRGPLYDSRERLLAADIDLEEEPEDDSELEAEIPAATLLQRIMALDILDPAITASGASKLSQTASLRQILPDISRLLRRLSFLCVYPWVVRRGIRTESWMGARRSARARSEVVDSRIEEGMLTVTTPDGELLLELDPLCQLLPPAPGAQEEIFLFDGPSRFGARLVAFPIGFERHDSELWNWYREHLIDADSDSQDDGASAATSRPPYLGLSSFSADDADYYFGREREVHACVNRLRVTPFLAVVGPSGSGKSSFVQAGIVPAMPRYWRTITVRPGPTPLAQLATRLAREGVLDPSDAGNLRALLQADPGALGKLLRRRTNDAGEPILLVVDQFEELLTLCLDAEERELYASGLMRAARASDDPVRVIITLRDDFLIRAQQLLALRDRLQHSLQILSTPPPAELERILVEPARRAGHQFEDPMLPREMVAAVAEVPSALALLSFTAAKLWEARDRKLRRLTRQSYKDLSGVGGALAQHAEEVLEAMTDEQKALVREVFRQLITAEGTRAVLTRSELTQILGGESTATAALEALIGARLLMASEGEGGEDRIEVVHEALLSSWPRLVRWQREDAESARLRDQLRAASRQWTERGRPRGMLWRGDALLEYRVWRGRYAGALTESEEDFARTSLREETRGRRIRRGLASAAFVILAVGLAVVLYLARQADHQRDRAEAFASQSQQRMIELFIGQGRQKLLDRDPMQAFVFLAEARKAGAEDPATDFMLSRAIDSLAGQLLVLSSHRGALYGAEFSPDGKHIATAGADHTARLWDAISGKLLHTFQHEKEVWMMAFRRDGSQLATAGWDGVVNVWSTATGQLVWSGRHDGALRWVGYDHGGTRLVTAGSDKKARIWDPGTGKLLGVLEGHTRTIMFAAFGPGDDVLVTASLDGTARVWNVATGKLVTTLTGDGAPLIRVTMGPDGQRVVVADTNHVAHVISLAGGQALLLTGHADAINEVIFSPEGASILTASEDKTAKVWDAQTGKVLLDLSDHAGGVTDASFSPDGHTILTANRDGTIQIWDARTGFHKWVFVGHDADAWRASYDARGDRIVSAGFDGTARVWDAHQLAYTLALEEHAHMLGSASFSRDGKRIATAQSDGAVRLWRTDGQLALSLQAPEYRSRVVWSPDSTRLLLSQGKEWTGNSGPMDASIWDAHTGALLRSISAFGGQIFHGEYAPGGQRIVTAEAGGTAALRDVATGEVLLTLRGHQGEVWFAAFDPRGERVVTASKDTTARIWDADTGKLLHILQGHTLEVHAARFSQDGTRVITTSDDNTAKIWTDSGQLVTTLEGHVNSVFDGAFSPDGVLAVTVSRDGTARVWDARTGSLLWIVDHHGNPIWSVEVSADGSQFLVAAGKRAMAWSLAYDHLSLAELDSFAACRVSYSWKNGRLTRTAIDQERCRSNDMK